ncbi:hypothetical protein BDF19DRAFT_464242 [Syncephalis fuscata]|nr:hypothetical protein BDF19DRAFT_464242 [Syncephalis fuscata]
MLRYIAFLTLILVLSIIGQGLKADAAAILNEASDGGDIKEYTYDTKVDQVSSVNKQDDALEATASDTKKRSRPCISCFWLPTCDKIPCTNGTCRETPQTCYKCGTAICFPDN